MAGAGCHRVAAACPRLASIALAGVLAASLLVAALAGGPGTAQAGVSPVRAAAAALARASARAATLKAALTGLQTRAEVLTERYDRETVLEQQAAAAYRATAARLAAARKAARRDSVLLARQAAADYEADGGPSAAASMFAAGADPQGYLGALGLQQTLDSRRVDLLAAGRADAIVTRLFSRQAAVLLGRQRADARSAGFLKLAVVAAVGRQVSAVRAARASRSRLASRLVRARAAARARAAQARAAAAGPAGAGAAAPPPGLSAAVLAGGPGGASPGVVAPAWSADAGASAAQGDIAASWALTQLGRPYQWGAAGPSSYDCSGLALEAWARAGVALLHWTGFQWVSGPHVPLRQLRRGDLVFFATNVADPTTIHHVGIYIGDGQMVDAPHTGAFVRIDSVYAFPGLIGATRPAA